MTSLPRATRLAPAGVLPPLLLLLAAAWLLLLLLLPALLAAEPAAAPGTSLELLSSLSSSQSLFMAAGDGADPA